jgi:hypothetical protein
MTRLQNIIDDWNGTKREVRHTAIGWNPGGDFQPDPGPTPSGTREYYKVTRPTPPPRKPQPKPLLLRAALAALVLLLLVACVVLSSCSPYETLPRVEQFTPTPAPSVTASPLYTRVYKPAPAPVEDPFCTVTTGYDQGAVNIRAAGNVNAAVIVIAHEGDTLTVTNRAAWLEVLTSDGTRGFINSRYCEIGE